MFGAMVLVLKLFCEGWWLWFKGAIFISGFDYCGVCILVSIVSNGE